MKIAIIHPYMDLLGGAERTTCALADALKKTQYDTTLFSLTETDIKDSHNFSVNIVHQTRFPYLWKYKRMFDNKKIYSTIKDQKIIIIMDGGFGFRYLKNKITIIYCNSTFEFEKEFCSRKIPGWRGILYKIIQKDIMKNLMDLNKKNVFLVSNSEYTKSKIRDLFNNESFVIYPPVDLESFIYPDPHMKTLKVATISRYAPEKNIGFIMEVIKSGKFNFELIGNSKKFQIELFKKMKKETVDHKNIILHNNISQELMKKILFSSKVYFHAAKETFGISVVESIAAGCIPIVPDNSAHPETVPIKELRYRENDISDAQDKINRALSGEFDHLLPVLKSHITQFRTEIFQSKMISFLKQVS